jgi:hypothetical protein
MKQRYKIYEFDKVSDAEDKPSDAVRYRDTRVISNGYFSVLRNQFISFSERKRSKKIDYDDGEYF